MKSKLKIIIPVAVAVIAIIAAIIFIRFSSDDANKISKMLDTAQKYLVEQNYEQAIAEFENIIELDPMNADAYIGIAEAYIKMGNTEMAVEWLEKGFEATGDESLKAMLDELLSTSGETTAITTVTVAETTTTEEITTLSAEEQEIEDIRKQALEIIAPFVPNKNKGEPNSVVYTYYEDYAWLDPLYYGNADTYSCFRCTYDENGDISKEEYVNLDLLSISKSSSENIIEYNFDAGFGHIIEYNPYSSKMYSQKYYRSSDDITYAATTASGNTWNAVGGIDNWYNRIENGKIVKSSDIYEIDEEYYSYKIYTQKDKINKIERVYGEYANTLEYDEVNNRWIYHYFQVTPYKLGLPEGADESIFDVEDKIVKTFDNYDEFMAYIENN
ncbi:MAG: tetratricopeptide repeat protein [Oscillospiraceae bacterium]|nr:tetratricopeptide repeat protein [Oscillospiraceae bacterium]